MKKMKEKICTTLVILMIACTVCYGATSEDMSVYVRKDVFDAKMDAFMSEIRLMNEQLRGEIRALGARIDGVETSLNARIDGVETSLNARIDGVETSLNSRMDKMETSLNSRMDRMENRIDGVERRMSTLETMIYWILATLSAALAALALTPYMKELRKSSITLEDVSKLIEENNVKLLKSLQA